MTALDALKLVKTKSPEELSAEDVSALRELISSLPSICTTLGGTEAVERYLAAAEAALSRCTMPAAEEPLEKAPAEQQHQPEVDRVARRRRTELALYAVVIATGGFLPYRFMAIDGSTQSNPESRQPTGWRALETQPSSQGPNTFCGRAIRIPTSPVRSSDLAGLLSLRWV